MEMEINLKELFKFIISKIGFIILSIILFIGIGVIYINFILTPMYRSSTTIILVSNEGNNNSTLLQSEVNLNKNLVTTYSEIVKSRSVLKKVIRNLDLDMSIQELSNSINVSSVENTEIIKIEVSNQSNQLAKEIADITATVFKDEVLKIYNLTNVSIVDKAYLATSPYNVNPTKQILIFAGGGFILSIGIIFLIFYFDTSIKTSEDIEEKLGISAIGNVTLVNNNAKKKSINTKNTELVVNNNPKSSFSESIKTIRTNLQFYMMNNDTKVILLTSPEPGDGKSFVSANLAIAFAQENKRVLLIDSDLRKGRQHRIFKVGNDKRKGYSNLILSSKDRNTIRDFIVPTEIKNLHLLPYGNYPPNPSELLASTNNQELIEKLRDMYDIIILDCAPTLGLNDTLVMTKLSDINVVVVTKRKTKIESLHQVKKNFEKVNAKTDGVILNKVKQKESSYYGYYGEH